MPGGIIDPTLPPPPPYTAIAVPNGTTDCTRALKDALERSRDTGLPVGLRPGRYRVTDTLDVSGAALLGNYRAPFQPRAPWETIWSPARDPRTRIIVGDAGIAGAFADGVIVADIYATRLAGFELVCEQRPPSFTKADYLHERASPSPSVYRVDTGIHIVSNNSLVRDVQVAGAGRVCWHIESQGARFESCSALYSKGDGFWIENGNGCSFNAVQVRYCDGPNPIFVRGEGHFPGSIRERKALALGNPDYYKSSRGCELRTVNVAHCANAVAQFKILDTEAVVLVSGGWFEDNGGDGFVIHDATGVRIQDFQMSGSAPNVAVYFKGVNHNWSNQVEGLLVSDDAYARIKIEYEAVLEGDFNPRVQVLDEWRPLLGAPYYSPDWYSKSNKVVRAGLPDPDGMPIDFHWLGPP